MLVNAEDPRNWICLMNLEEKKKTLLVRGSRKKAPQNKNINYGNVNVLGTLGPLCLFHCPCGIWVSPFCAR
jgi:hypothetical protein